MKGLRKNNTVYKFVHGQDETIKTNITGRVFSNDWLEISEDGTIVVKGSNKVKAHWRGYAWDGCSPKINFMDITWGTPDGRLDPNTEKPITYYASMFHDVLYQFKSEIPISRKEADVIFRMMLSDARFCFSGVYYFFVRVFGGCFGKWKTTGTQVPLKMEGYSWQTNS